MTMIARQLSSSLRERMDLTCGRLYTTSARFWQQPRLDAAVPEFLILMHQVVRASVPLMEAAHAVARSRAGEDPVCRALAEYLPEHIEEERHHDTWLLDDLEAAGIATADVTERIPPPGVASLVGAQYYWLHHHHPVGLLGYMRVLEGNAPSEAHIKSLEDRSGLPATLFRTYRLHGALDPTHHEDIDALIDALPLSPSQEVLLWISASHTATSVADCLDRIERECTR